MARRDYYEVLGVTNEASSEDIKRAYRRLAVKYHPDKNAGDPNAEDRFKEVGEAYKVLGDEKGRAQYDRYGHEGVGSAGARGGVDFGTTDFVDLFSQVFGDFGDVFGVGRGAGRRGSDLRVDLEISLEDAYTGTTRVVELPKMDACGTCGGSGVRPGTRPRACPQCGGRGKLQFQQGFFSVQQTCPRCQGMGEVITDPCIECRGEGRLHRTEKVSITIPRGVDDGMVLRINGQGDAGVLGASPGNLLVGVRVTPHSVFKRKGDDLYLEHHLSIIQAALGTNAEIPLLNGESERITVTPGSQAGHVTALRGRGMPRLQRHGSGDLRVLFVVETPQDLSPKEEDLLREFARLRGESDKKPGESTGHASADRKSKRGWFAGISDLLGGVGHEDS